MRRGGGSLRLPSTTGGGGGTPPPSTGRGDLPHWKLIFDDDFLTPVSEGSMFAKTGDHAQGLGAYKNWGAQTYLTTYGGHNGTGDYYGINNMSVVSGITGANGNCLQMRLLVNDGTGKKVGCNPFPNTSGTYGSSSASSSQLYGRYESRWKSSGMAGWKLAWLIWPQSWQWDFEIDWIECALNGNIGSFNHWPSSSHNASSADGFSTSTKSTAFHTSTMEWTPSSVKFYLDGTLFGTSTRVPTAPGQSFLQSENSLSGGSSQPTADATIHVDYYSQWGWLG